MYNTCSESFHQNAVLGKFSTKDEGVEIREICGDDGTSKCKQNFQVVRVLSKNKTEEKAASEGSKYQLGKGVVCF